MPTSAQSTMIRTKLISHSHTRQCSYAHVPPQHAYMLMFAAAGAATTVAMGVWQVHLWLFVVGLVNYVRLCWLLVFHFGFHHCHSFGPETR